MKWDAFFLVLSLVLTVATTGSSGEHFGLAGTLADYAKALRYSVEGQSRIDVEGTIAALKEAHIPTYNFLIWYTDTEWKDFQRFLPAAKEVHITVWVTLIPPSEGGDSLPYRTDYITWFRKIAELSVVYENLIAINIDDFANGRNLETFTPEYVRAMVDTMHAINPRLNFCPTMYRLKTDFVKRYGDLLDGVLFYWRDLDSFSGLKEWLEAGRRVVGGKFPIITGIYCAPTSWHRDPPKPMVVLRTMEIAREHSDGLMLYCLDLAQRPPSPGLGPSHTPLFKLVQRAFGEWRGLIEPTPRLFRLNQNAPNPFGGATTILYDLPRAERTSLVIYNFAAQKVRTLVDRWKPAGSYSVIWDGTDEKGRRVASGTYLCQMKAGTFEATKRMVLIR